MRKISKKTMEMMIHLNIKPLSVNKAYRGRRFASYDLKAFKTELSLIVPPLKIPKGQLLVKYCFGVSSKGSDGDNLIKAFQDCLAEIYGFNDNQIYKWIVEKEITKKGKEFIKFEISKLLK